jgi:hypothetical protein
MMFLSWPGCLRFQLREDFYERIGYHISHGSRRPDFSRAPRTRPGSLGCVTGLTGIKFNMAALWAAQSYDSIFQGG